MMVNPPTTYPSRVVTGSLSHAVDTVKTARDSVRSPSVVIW